MSRRGSEPAVSHYCGLATISDGVTDSTQDVEIHIRPGGNAIAAAWHAIIKEKLPNELRSPHGKTVSVHLASGGQGVGILVDPRLIRGAGEPPPV